MARVHADQLERAREKPCWALSSLAGGMVELSSETGAAVLTLAFELVLEAQRSNEPVAWVTSTGSTFFPPDAAAAGVDLDALSVVRVPKSADIPRAGDKLLRSGAFGLVVLDLGAEARVAPPLLSRLCSLCQKHGAVLLCLTEKSAHLPSLGSLVSIRAEAQKARIGPSDFRCEVSILKDKRHGHGWSHSETYRGPPGLR